ncbi:hypothetical protein KGO06_01455 [Patescibacteria group bacterium]|nr:hypothetical protein [Patescibacteria group bacterium]
MTIAGNAFSALIIAAGGLFVFFSNPRARTNQLFAFLMLSTLLYQVFYILAALQREYFAAYFWWFLNSVDVFITMAVVHFVLHSINRASAWRSYIRLTYLTGIAIFIYAWADPQAFLPLIEPKLYFYFYLEAGWLYSVMLAYFLLFPLPPFIALIAAYRRAQGVERRRYEYFILMLLIGYALGTLNFALVYDIPLDPLFGSLFGLFFIPIAYGIFAVNLLDIRILARRALVYGLSVGGLAAVFAALILVNDFLVRAVPYLSFITVPLIAALVSVTVARGVWSMSRDTERLKYEFITIATHKLRTPLTRIRWEVPGLLERAKGDPELVAGLQRIDASNSRLIELTNILMDASRIDEDSYAYAKEPVDLHVLIHASLARFDSALKEKNISVVTRLDPDAGKPVGDSTRLASVVDILIENAIAYNRNGGSVHVSLSAERRGVRLAVRDSGIGIPKADLARIFSSFYRTDAAKRADTEGVGIGLSIAKHIVAMHGGKMGAESPGEGKGSTFWVALPV